MTGQRWKSGSRASPQRFGRTDAAQRTQAVGRVGIRRGGVELGRRSLAKEVDAAVRLLDERPIRPGGIVPEHEIAVDARGAHRSAAGKVERRERDRSDLRVRASAEVDAPVLQVVRDRPLTLPFRSKQNVVQAPAEEIRTAHPATAAMRVRSFIAVILARRESNVASGLVPGKMDFVLGFLDRPAAATLPSAHSYSSLWLPGQNGGRR